MSMRGPRAVGFFVLSLLLLAAVAAARQPAPGAGGLEARRAALTALLDEQWQYTMRTGPEFASILGDKRYNDQVSDLSLAAVEKDLAAKRLFLSRFQAIDTTGFPEQEVLNKRLMVRNLEMELDGARFKPWEMQENQMGGLHLEYPQFPSMLSFGTAKDYDDLITRYRKVPVLFDQNIELMRHGMADGHMPPRFVITKIVQQTRAIAAQEGEDSPFAAPLKSFPPSLPAAEQSRIRTAMMGAIQTAVLPAYRKFADFVEHEYLPKGRTEPGLWSVPDGDAFYAYLVRVQTTSDMTPEQIHQLGLRQVADLEKQMATVAASLGYKDLKAFNAKIQGDAELHAKSREQILDLYRGYIDHMYAKLPELFGRLPKAKVVVEPTESFREKEASAAEYQSPAPDGSRPGRVQVNTSEPTSRKTITMESTAYHEGVPGHHMQLAIAQELPTLPPFRQNGGYTAFVEGWALYSERLGKEVGFYTNPYNDYGRLQDEMLRAIRLVVDTGLHYKHWTRDQVVQFFHDHSATDEVEVQSETDRYIVAAGQALAYKIGQLKITELREKARRELGAKFDIRAYHDEVLGAGALPLDVLEERINAWIAAGKAGGK